MATQFYWPSAIYGLTPCEEAVAMEAARWCQPQPVQRLGLPEYSDDDHGDDGSGLEGEGEIL